MIPDDPRSLLGPLEVPEPSPDLVPRVLASARPLLAAHARRATARAWVRPLAVSLLPLPLIVAVNVTVVRALYGLLSTVLPDVVSTYLVGQYALLVLVMLGLTYAAVPVLADRQARALLENSHV
jgi:hypothetical protein